MTVSHPVCHSNLRAPDGALYVSLESETKNRNRAVALWYYTTDINIYHLHWCSTNKSNYSNKSCFYAFMGNATALPGYTLPA